MKKILSIQEAIRIAKKIKKQGKTIVLVGGFFDILHLGHIKFLEKSKKYGDCLFILLEEDSKATKEKGKKRPINSQETRAKILSALIDIDYVVMLKNMTNNARYDKIIVAMKPNVIAITYGDPNTIRKKRQARLINAKVVCAIKKVNDQSSTKYIESINN